MINKSQLILSEQRLQMTVDRLAAAQLRCCFLFVSLVCRVRQSPRLPADSSLGRVKVILTEVQIGITASLKVVTP